MDIIRALRWSKEFNKSVIRAKGGQWIRYGSDYLFRLRGEDLLATDWMPTDEYVSKLTGGEWQHVESD